MAGKTNISEFNNESKLLTKNLSDLEKVLTGLINQVVNLNGTLKQVQTTQKQTAKNTQELTNLQKERIKVTEKTKQIFAQTIALNEKSAKTLIKAQEARKKKIAALREEITGEKAAKKAKQELIDKQKEAIKQSKLEIAERKKYAAEQTKIFKKSKEGIRQKVIEAEKTRALTNEVKKELGVVKKGSGFFGKMTKSILASAAAFLSFRAAFMVMKNSIKTIAGFEKALSEVAAITKALPADFKRLKEDALRLGASTSKTSIEVAQLQKEFAKLGLTTNEIIGATEATINLSIAAGSDLAESAIVAASTLKQFDISASQTTKVTDIMALSFSSSALDLEKFKVSMATVGPVAKTAGVSLERTTALLSVLSDAGLDASSSGTALRNIYLELAKQGLTWDQAMSKINDATNKNAVALDIFGKRSATAAILLADNADKADILTESYENSAGAAKKMADIMEDNLIGDTKILSSAWEGLILSINKGDGAFSKFLRNVVGGTTIIITWIRRLGMAMEDINMEKTYDEAKRSVEELLKVFDSEKKSMDDRIKGLNLYISLSEKNIKMIENTVSEGEKMAENISLIYSLEKNKLILLKNALEAEKTRNTEIIISQDEIITSQNEIIEKEKEGQEVKRETIKLTKLEAIEAGKLAIEAGKVVIKAEKVVYERKKTLDELILAEKQRLVDKFVNEQEYFANVLNIEKEFYKNELDTATLTIDQEIELRHKILDVELEINQIIEDDKKRKHDEEIERINERLSLISEIGNQIFEIGSMFRDAEMQEIENQKNYQLKLAGDNEKKREQIEEKFEKKSAEIKRKQAISDKANAIFNAVINTAVAVTKTLANPILSAIIATLGAIQIAAISAKPIPKFKEGTKGKLFSDTLAYVGDGGVSEIIQTPDNQFYQTPAKDTLTYLPKGSQVYPDVNTFINQQGGISEGKMDELIKATNKKQGLSSVNLTSRGLEKYSMINNTRLKWQDSYIRK